MQNQKIGALSYGYLMDMLWLSYGEGSLRVRCESVGSPLGVRFRGVGGSWEGCAIARAGRCLIVSVCLFS